MSVLRSHVREGCTMSFYAYEIVTPPEHLPVTVAAADMALGAAVVEEIERVHLWRGIVRQTRRITLDGQLPARIELEPVTAIVSLTRWTPTNDAAVIPEASYYSVTRDPHGTIVAPNGSWPAPERPIGSFALNYECGFQVTPESSQGAGDAINAVPAAVRFMIERAVKFRSVSGGVGDIKIGSLDLSVPDTYSTDQLPREITNLGRAWMWRPGIFTG